MDTEDKFRATLEIHRPEVLSTTEFIVYALRDTQDFDRPEDRIMLLYSGHSGVDGTAMSHKEAKQLIILLQQALAADGITD